MATTTTTTTTSTATSSAVHKVAIVYSDTSANLYFSQTAYSDLFMAAQNQARMAGVSYDVIDESQLTNINNLAGYDALIFPAMPDVNSANLSAIVSTLTQFEQQGKGIITAGDFLTNDQTGAALSGNSYANMQTLLGLTRSGGTASPASSITVNANDVTNPIMQGYTANQAIQTYQNESSNWYSATTGTTSDVLATQNVAGVGTENAVLETQTGGTNVHFATADLLGDSNLLSNAIQKVALGSTQPGVALHDSRQAGIVAMRMDMDQSQYPGDVSPTGSTGIYDKLIPILQQWNQQYDFTGSFYINIGDNPTSTTEPTGTNWTTSLPYYKEIQAMGGEIGNHSYTHLINPPTQTFTATTATATAAGATQITLTSVPNFAGATVGMMVAGTGITDGTTVPTTGAIANTMITGVSGNTITIAYLPGGYGTADVGTTAAIPAGTTLTFTIPQENTNFLQTTGTVLSATNQPFTYDYEFNQSKLLEEQELGTTIYGAAIPGAPETYATDQNILPYYQSVAATATTPGYTGYVTGGWTGIGSGYPSAFGYMSPTDTGSVYIAPNMTFDFTDVEYQGKSVAATEADWAAQFKALTANAAGTPVVVWPIHDYGAAAWNGPGATSPYTTQMYTDFISQAYAANYEFVTLEDLASRMVAQQKANISYTTTGNTINATVTPDPTAPDVGEMSLNVVNGGSDVIQNAGNWYAYNSQEIFLPRNGGSFSINLGTKQDDVTHISALPMRADLLSVTGDGSSISFSVTGEGQVTIQLQSQSAVSSVTGATIASQPTVQNGNTLVLNLSGTGQHDVSVKATSPLTVQDTTTNQPIPAVGTAYTGPVSGIRDQYINVTSDSLNITANTDNWFLHSGAGTDAIAAHGGTNVLDGGTGSNFLTGGSGTDTFFVDDRGAAADIWSTLNNFHAGDAATIWGMTQQDLDMWQDNQGASGYTGLTLHAKPAGDPWASLTLVGYTTADLTNGRLSVSFGSVGGSNYMYVHANA